MMVNEALLFGAGALFGVVCTAGCFYGVLHSFLVKKWRLIEAMEASHREDMRTQAQVLLARSSGSASSPVVDEEALVQHRRERELPISMRV
jgi:hypothetical protein